MRGSSYGSWLPLAFVITCVLLVGGAFLALTELNTLADERDTATARMLAAEQRETTNALVKEAAVHELRQKVAALQKDADTAYCDGTAEAWVARYIRVYEILVANLGAVVTDDGTPLLDHLTPPDANDAAEVYEKCLAAPDVPQLIIDDFLARQAAGGGEPPTEK